MKISRINWQIVICSISLLSLGILTIYSSSIELGLQQFIFAVFGLLLFYFFSQLDYRLLKPFVYPAYFFILTLLVIVFILGFETRGSARWISLGLFNLQPSELIKPVVIFFLAYFWQNHIPSWRNIALSFFWLLPALILIFKQPDLGTSLTMVAIWLGILFAARISFKKILALLLVFALIVPIGWSILHGYQKERVIGFLSPNNDPLGVGYNLIQSTIAVGSGGLFGRGLGQGTQSRLQFLPEYRTDFIFASIAEEMGFLGAMLITLFYLFLIIYFLKLSSSSADSLGFLFTIGVISMLLFQVVINIGMNIGLFPITGITLPLVSYGGSSVVATLVSFGILSSIAKHSQTGYNIHHD